MADGLNLPLPRPSARDFFRKLVWYVSIPVWLPFWRLLGLTRPDVVLQARFAKPPHLRRFGGAQIVLELIQNDHVRDHGIVLHVGFSK